MTDDRRTLVYGETTTMALRWCRANGIKPLSRTYILNGKQRTRGLLLTPEDRAVFIGDVENRPDYEDVVAALLPALRDVGGMDFVEWVRWPEV